MASELRDRLALVERLLLALPPDSAAHRRASEAQSAVLQRLLVSSQISLDLSAEVAEAAARIRWHQESHKAIVVAALASSFGGKADGAGSMAQRRPQHNFEAIVNYYTAAQWDVMVGQEFGPQVKMRALFEHPYALGLRLASERTVQKLTTLYLCVTEGAQAVAMHVSQKLACTKQIKRELKSSGNHPPLAFLKDLPLEPSALRANHPSVYDAVFSKLPPVQMKVDFRMYTDVLGSVRCRGVKDFAAVTALESTNFSTVAKEFMQQMQQMQHVQMVTLQALAGSSHGSAGSRLPIVMTGGGGPCDDLQLHHQQQHQQQQHHQQRSALALPPTFPEATVDNADRVAGEGKDAGEEKNEEEVEEKSEGHEQQVEAQQPLAKKQRLSYEDSVKLIFTKMGERSEEKKVAKAAEENHKVADNNMAKVAEATKKVVKAVQSKTHQPHYTIERTRGIVQCLSGRKGPGQYHCIKIGDAGEEAAIKKAKQWVRDKTKELYG